MVTQGKTRAGVFSYLALLFVIMAAFVLVRVYVLHAFPIFTDEQQIDDAKSEEFGSIANYL